MEVFFAVVLGVVVVFFVVDLVVAAGFFAVVLGVEDVFFVVVLVAAAGFFAVVLGFAVVFFAVVFAAGLAASFDAVFFSAGFDFFLLNSGIFFHILFLCFIHINFFSLLVRVL